MERHKCKLCSRSFANGRALGGHMKAHLGTFPLPPKLAGGSRDSVFSSSSPSSDDDEEEGKTSLVYGLRENPKKSIRLADREFSFAGSISIVQDGESETESKNPTRRRSKRTRRLNMELNQNQPPPNWAESSPEPEPETEPASSVSDTSPEEDVAMCLVMLSMDRPMSDNGGKDQSLTPESKKSTAKNEGLMEIKSMKKSRARNRNRCEKCQKSFRSNRALNGHRKICSRNEEQDEEDGNGGNWKIFKCPYCCKVFGSGQALGGHKRSHLSGSTRTVIDANSTKLEIGLDLNLPAPVEEDDYSVVSDA